MPSEKRLAHLRIVMTLRQAMAVEQVGYPQNAESLVMSSYVIVILILVSPPFVFLLRSLCFQHPIHATKIGALQKRSKVAMSHHEQHRLSRSGYAAPLGAKPHAGATSLPSLLRINAIEFAPNRIFDPRICECTSSSWHHGFHSPRLLGISGVLVKVPSADKNLSASSLDCLNFTRRERGVLAQYLPTIYSKGFDA